MLKSTLTYLAVFSETYPVVVAQIAALLIGAMLCALLCRAHAQHQAKHLTQTREVEIACSVARYEKSAPSPVSFDEMVAVGLESNDPREQDWARRMAAARARGMR